jgi:3-isopropylmalate/(R)-2-methylmalate dehydratase small subunit
VFNQDAYKGAAILAAGPNFGCGSSREGAVTAIAALGVRCILAESFGDIFYANCFQNGLLPVRLSAPQMERVAAAAAEAGVITVDLELRKIILPAGETFDFEIAALRREALLSGLDDIGLSLRRLETIRGWQAVDRYARPWIWDLPPGLSALDIAPFEEMTA